VIAAKHLASASHQRVEVIVLTVLVCGLIVELVRRKRLREGYALLWIGAGVVIALLGIWKGLLTHVSHAIGIYYPPSALFAVAFVFVLGLLIHFSLALSRLAEQNKRLAQHVAMLRDELDAERERNAVEA
jgi:hypothetical protein